MSGDEIDEDRVLANAHNLVKKQLDEAPANGDDHYWHKRRVHSMAVRLAARENIEGDSLLAMRLAALLQDVENDIYADLPNEAIDVSAFLETQDLPQAFREKVLGLVLGMSFKGDLAKAAGRTSKELAIVQDADILDAIGAIGIARCFTYGGKVDRVMHDPCKSIRRNTVNEAYKNDQPTTLNHFYERLVKLQALVKTDAGKEVAAKRNEFLKKFLRQFHSEWVADV